MDFVELLKTIAERVWFYAFLVGVFCIMALIAPDWGLGIPVWIVEWLNLGLIFALSLLIVTTGETIFKAVRERLRLRKERLHAASEAELNVQSLLGAEQDSLASLLSDCAPRRFRVGLTSPLYPLLEKRVLVVVDSPGDTVKICEVAKPIYDDRVRFSSILIRA